MKGKECPKRTVVIDWHEGDLVRGVSGSAAGKNGDAPISVFPISWQDTGSGVLPLTALAVLLDLGPLRVATARSVTFLAGLGAVGALLADVYLY